MKITITSRHFKAHETLTAEIESKLNDLSKYNEEILHADVILSYEKPTHSIKISEILVKLKDKLLTAKESDDDFSKSFDKALSKIENQLLKHKDKINSRKHEAQRSSN
ncbi:MAG TPA: ribosome-associated translation inhibitor RaiA [Bacteroidetes bacterium]|nr:ribosome-associated translation inhibitor RaiA [Bacteroidota bacterium]HCN36973.1 ribosome-associated translation inhibitor RaiA [Bacteroidota bacterium]